MWDDVKDILLPLIGLLTGVLLLAGLITFLIEKNRKPEITLQEFELNGKPYIQILEEKKVKYTLPLSDTGE